MGLDFVTTRRGRLLQLRWQLAQQLPGFAESLSAEELYAVAVGALVAAEERASLDRVRIITEYSVCVVKGRKAAQSQLRHALDVAS